MEKSEQLYFEMPNLRLLGIQDYIITNSNNLAFDLILKIYKKRMSLNVIGVDAKKTFISRLEGITDPEDKRKIIGKSVKIYCQEVKKRKFPSSQNIYNSK